MGSCGQRCTSDLGWPDGAFANGAVEYCPAAQQGSPVGLGSQPGVALCCFSMYMVGELECVRLPGEHVC